MKLLPPIWTSTCSDLHFTHSPSPPATPLPPSSTILPVFKVCVEDVNQVFRKQKSRKASGPDGISPACLKVCADQLAPIFTQIFNRSLELCEVPCCFKHSTIIPVPKMPKITGLNDYRPVALTSVIKKSLERLVLSYLKDITRPLLDPLQFAYRANRSVVTLSIWDCITSCNTSTNLGITQGSYLWTSGRPSRFKVLVYLSHTQSYRV